MKTFRRTVTSAACALVSCVVLQGSANAGVLYFDFNRNTIGQTASASLFLFGNAGQAATVTSLDGFSQNVVLGANGFFNLAISNIYQQSGTGIRDTGFKVDSASAIAGYFVNRAGFSTDMTYLLDSAALGTQYVVASQGGGFGEGSQIAIHATQDNTNVTLNRIGGAAIAVTLAAGETYKFAGGSTNQTGATISSDKPVAVFSGHECAQVPVGRSFCDTLLEQAIPTDKLSKNYLITASKGAALAGGDLVRVIATADNTQIKVNGVVVATINTGAYHEFTLGAGAGASIEASNAVAVAQYLQGGSGTNTDPAMSYVPGADTWLESYRLATPSGGAAFVENYASIVIDTDDLGSLMLNGAAVNTAGFTAIGTTGFSRGIVDLPLGLFDLDADSDFLVMLGGGSNADSYFTYGGSTFAPGISPPPPPPPPPPPTGVSSPGTALLAFAGLLGVMARRRRSRTD